MAFQRKISFNKIKKYPFNALAFVLEKTSNFLSFGAFPRAMAFVSYYSVLSASLLFLAKQTVTYLLPRLSSPLLTAVLPYGYAIEALLGGIVNTLLPRAELSESQKTLRNAGFTYTNFLLNMSQGAATSLAFTFLKGKFILGATGSLLSVATGFGPALIVCIIVIPLITNEIATLIHDANIDAINTIKKNKALSIVQEEGKGEDIVLINAVKNGSFKTIKILVSEGVNSNVKDNRGRTPLHHAVIEKDYKLVIFFLSQGADVNVEDIYRKTPFIMH